MYRKAQSVWTVAFDEDTLTAWELREVMICTGRRGK